MRKMAGLMLGAILAVALAGCGPEEQQEAVDAAKSAAGITAAPSSAPASPAPAAGGDFCTKFQEIQDWTRANGMAPDQKTWATEMTRRLTELKPIAPAAVQGDLGVVITGYSSLAAGGSILALADSGVPASIRNMNTACGKDEG
jgi:hypothetical protein